MKFWILRCWSVRIAIITVLSQAAAVLACGGYGEDAELIRMVEHQPVQAATIDALRSRGQEAIDDLSELRQQWMKARATLLAKAQEHAKQIARFDERIARLDALIDKVGKQKYCSRSRLFWHTDLEAAKAAAKASGKPILSLRMLGNLDEEFSCANSRFFRTTLYANAEISAALRSGYVLHWKSVRPVPKVTIDFGDGRKLERTLTGNSIHYILTPDGEVVDALPGLYGPKAFLQKITDGAALAKNVAELPAEERKATLVGYHQAKFNAIGEEFARDLAKVSKEEPAAIDVPLLRNAAAAAGKIAAPKYIVERPLVAAAVPSSATPEKLDDEETWRKIAALHAEESQLDQASRELIRSENPTAAVAGVLAITKRRVEDPLVRLVRSLEESIALDTVRNEYQLHRRIHGWLADGAYRPDVEALNSRVYGEVFLTPETDPWLGLAPADAYTALPNGGVVAGNR